MSDLIFLDGKLIPLSRARLSHLNSALLFGESLFETLPVYGGAPLFLEEHLDRVHRGCGFVGWPFLSKAKVLTAIRLFSERLPASGSFMVRLSLVQEVDPPAGPRAFSPSTPKFFASTRPLRHDPASFWPPVGNVGIGKWVVPGRRSFPFGFKWPFYMMIRRDLRAHPDWEELLRLNEEGYVVDGGGSSPLWFEGRVVRIPPTRWGGLESVTRKKIIGLCGGLGLRVEEKPWKPPDALKKGELVFVGSGVGVMGVSRFLGRPVRSKSVWALRLWQHYRGWTGEKGIEKNRRVSRA